MTRVDRAKRPAVVSRAVLPCRHPDDRAEVLFAARDYITGRSFEVSRCSACGLSRTVPAPAPAELAAYYPPAYWGSASSRRFPALVEALQKRFYGARARAVERLAGSPGRVLDVGCGRGYLLDAFRRRGWEVQGTELDERSAVHAREVLGIPVQVGVAGVGAWPDRSFDAVALWHVLEHLHDPAAALADAARVLRPGGVLMVGVPSFASLEARLGRGAWFHLDVPRHLVHLTPPWLEAALATAGLEVRRRSFFAPEFDAFSFVQTVENRMGFRANLLYELLRGRGAKLLGRSAGGRLEAALALLLAAPLGVLALPATGILSLAEQGSSVTFLAVKR